MDKNDIETTLLDSSLISSYKLDYKPKKIYDLKVVVCGDYVQVYEYENSQIKNNNLYERDILKKIDTDNLSNLRSSEPKPILLANAIRSKLGCQRLAKSNIDNWETFITLTFSKNITDIKVANEMFRFWTSNVRKLKKDFMYIAVPEFQKRGAVHYHILSNLGTADSNIIISQKNKKGRAVNIETLFDIKYWNKGYARVDFIKGNIKKIIGYISKYMTEDIDNKLFGKHRYFYSQNIKKTFTSFIDMSCPEDIDYFNRLIGTKEVIYQDKYQDIYTKSDILFTEYNIYNDNLIS